MAAHTGKGNTPGRSIRIPDDLWEAAKAEAEARSEDVSSAVVRFLREYTSNQPKVKS